MCHLLTTFPLLSIISFQCRSSSSPVLSRPMENQPMISFLLIFLIFTMENMRLTLGSSNSMIWKTKVSLNSGSYILRRMEVLLLDSCWPMELNIATFTYVSDIKNKVLMNQCIGRDLYNEVKFCAFNTRNFSASLALGYYTKGYDAWIICLMRNMFLITLGNQKWKSWSEKYCSEHFL